MPAPTAPTDLRLYQYLSGTSAQLLWIDRSTDEDSFVVERQLEGEADFTSVGLANAANGVGNGVWFTDTGLPNDAVAAYRVRAVNPLGSSGYTNVISVPAAPAAPAGLTAAAVPGTDNAIRLAWTDGSRRESGFRVYRKNPGSTSFTPVGTAPGVTGTGGTVTYTDTGATAGATHEYYVTAYNAAGESGESNRVTVAANPAVTAPAAPSGLNVYQYVSGTAFRAYFYDQSTNEDAFLLERKSEDEGDYAVAATWPAVAGAGTLIWQNVSGLAPDTSFSFRLRARNSVGDSSPSNVLTFVSAPVAPADLTAAAVAGTDNQVRLAWIDRSRRESGFRVYRRSSGSTSFTPVGTAPGVTGTGTTVSYVDSSVTAGGAYEYYVKAYNDVGESDESNRATATANPTATAPTAPSEFLLWNYVSATSLQFRFRDNSTNEAGFVVERKAEDDADYVAAAAPPALPGVGTYAVITVGAFAPDTRYNVRIRARNAVGDSAPSNVVTVGTAPTAPANLTAAAVAGTDNQIRLTWIDSSRHELGFRVYRKNPGATSFVPVTTVPGVTGTGGAVTYTDTGATAGGTHEYYVKAYNDAGESGESDHATAAAYPPATVPAAPSELQLWSYLSDTSLQLRFRDNSTNEAGFIVERKAEDEAEYVVLVAIPATAGANNYPYVTITGSLAPDTSYSFRVKARNSIGDSAPSNVVTAATAPVTASNLVPTALSSSQVRLTWTDNSRYETYFYVYRRNPGSTSFGYIGSVQGSAGRGSTVTYVDVNLAASTRYEYYVVARNDAGASGPSESAAVTTSVANAPGTPTSLTAAPVQRQVTLRWLDRSTDEALFVLERQAEGETTFAQIATAPARAGSNDFVFYTDGDLASDTAFTYRVKARNASGDSAYTNVATATTAPTAPVDLVANALPNTDNQIRLAWTSTGRHAAGFYVYRKRAGEAAFTNVGFVVGAAGAGTTVTFISSALIPRTAYTYYVVAYNDAGESPRSNEASATTLATDNTPPDTFIASGPAEGGVACVATPSFTFAGSDNYTPEANLRYQYRVDGGAWSAPAASAAATLPALSDGGHRLEVAAVDEAGNVDPTPALRNFVVDTVAPAITNVRAASVTATTATLAWATTKPTDSLVDFRAAGTAAWSSTRLAEALVSAHTVVLLGLQLGTTYEYRARSADACDREAVSGVATFATPGQTAAPETRITDGPSQGATIGAPSVRFAWAGEDDVTPGERLQFRWQLDASPWSDWSNATEHTFTDLAQGAHTVRVRSRDADGNEDATPAARAFVVDLAPPSLSNVAVEVRDGDALITWTTIHPATSQVEYGLTAAYGSSSPPNTGLLTRHEVRLTQLQPDATYHFRVRSTNAFGREQVSADATFVFTRLVPDLQVTAVTAPPDLLTDRTFDLGWTITNAGTGRASGPWLDRVYLSRDAVRGDGDALLAEFAFGGSLEPGQSARRTQTVTVARARVAEDGAYYLIVDTDADHLVNEPGGEDNNVGTTAVLVRRPPLPDLVVAAVTAPERAFFGQTIGVEWTVTNVGAAATDAPEWHDQVLLSPSPTPGGDVAVQVEVLNVSYLGAGESYAGRATVRVPRGLTGRHYVHVKADGRNRVAEGNDANNVASRPIELLLPPVPDLQVTQVQAAEEAFAGDTLLVAWRVENRGTGAVPPDEAPWTDAVYLSSDEAFNPRTARLLGEFAHAGALAPGEGYAQSQTVRVPKSVVGGDYRVFVLTDSGDRVYEYVFANNNVEHDRRRPTRVISTPPDLTVTTVTAPADAEAGRAIRVGWTVTNQAAFSAEGDWLDAVYVSGTPTLDVKTARLLARVPRGGTLEAGASYTQETTVTLPACPSGRQYLLVVTDSTNALFEFDPTADAEQNASAPQPIEVTSRPPDLTVTDVAALATGAAGQPVTVSWTVRNAGTGPTLESSWTDRVFLSRTPTLDTAGALPVDAFRHDGALAAGASYSRIELVTLPRQAQGTYYVLVETNADRAVTECGAEDNDVGGSARTLEVGSDLPNLEVVRVDAPNAVVAGRKVTLTWSVANVGGAAVQTPAWNDVVYLSTAPALDGGGRALATVIAKGPLEVGATYDASAEVTMPNVPAGTYYLVVAADRGDYVFEGAREGNVAVVPVVLAPPDVDLRVTAVDAPDAAYSGQALQVSWTVTNAGAEETPVARWTDVVILSRDLTPDPSDPVVGYAARQGALAGGASYTQTLAVTVPRGLSGPYSLFVRTDASDVVPETNGANNTSGRAVQLELPPPSDLAVADVVVAPNGTPGEPSTFRWTVRNQSANPATGQWEDAVYLSSGETWDVGDPLIGRVAHAGPVAPGQTYEASLTEVLPGLAQGLYRAIVRADIRNTVRETDDSNNTTASAAEMTVGVPELVLGTPLASDLRAGRERYYRVRVPAGETLRVTLDSQAADSANELYVRFGAAPSRARYDFLFSRPDEEDQEVVVPTTEAGDYYVLVRGESASDASAPFTISAELVPFEITSVSPRNIGDNGQVTMTLRGAKFAAGQTVELVKDGRRLTAAKVWAPDAATLKARFVFTDAPHGVYDVTVTDSAGGVASAPRSVAVEAATELTVTVNANGDTRPRFGRPFSTNAVVQNTANVDAPYVNILVTMDDDVVIRTTRPANSIPAYSEGANGIPESNAVNNGETLDAFLLCDIEPKQLIPLSASVTGFTKADPLFEITVLASSSVEFAGRVLDQLEDARIYATFNNESFGTNELDQAARSESAWRSYWMNRLQVLGIETRGDALDIEGQRDRSRAVVGIREAFTISGVKDFLLNPCGILAKGVLNLGCTASLPCEAGCACRFAFQNAIGICNLIKATAACARAAILNPAAAAGCEMAAVLFFIALRALNIARLSCCFTECDREKRNAPCLWYLRLCNKPLSTLGNAAAGAVGGSGVSLCPRRASDPNDKVGPSGYGPQAFVAAQQFLPYTIDFENVATATAAAQQVRITDHLAPELDWRTFRLTEIGFGTYHVPVPENRSFYQTRIPLGEDLGNLLADVSAGLDIRTGEVRWTLTAVDPATGEAPNSAALGLLPPNDATNRGQGFVRYTVRPRNGLPTGAVVTSTPATIVFDAEPPIDTNAVTNTLDGGAPASRVAPLPAEAPNTTFLVAWSGSDDSPNGSGLASYDVYVSVDDGPYSVWRKAVTDTSATFIGWPGRTYGFYSVARDNAGNVEAAPAAPQATTRVSDTAANPVPVVRDLVPASVEAGSPAFVLVVNGQDFVDDSKVLWNGELRRTTFVSPAQLTAVIPAADVANAGTAGVTVSSPGGGTSGALDFAVTAPVVGTSTLLVTGASARRVGDTFIVDVVIVNSGSGRATGVRLLDTTLLNAVAPSGALADPVSLAVAGGSATLSLSFPGTAAEPGSRVTLTVDGTSDQGTFTGSRRVNLP